MTTNMAVPPQSDLAIPPGELLEEELEARGMTQLEFARRTGRPPQAISEIIRGKKQITYDTALEFERVLRTPAYIWVNLEAEYQLARARQREAEELSRQEARLQEFPVYEMEAHGWIARAATPQGKVRELLRFFGVASFDVWQSTVVGFRITPGARVSIGSLAAWLRQAELEGHTIETEPYDATRFREALAAIRELTTEPVKTFVPRMQTLCASAGVTLAFVPEIPKSGASGCARWLTRDKALIALSLRYKTNDHLWFSFFHEACHILKHRIRQVFIEGIDDNGDPDAEDDANRFAADTLIPPDAWASFVGEHYPTLEAILTFAHQVRIAPGIVVGRLEHEGRIPYGRFHSQKVKLQWSERSK